MKNYPNLFVVIILLLIVGYITLGYYSSYIGYYGYNKDKCRRFSDTKEESVKRGVFITDIHFKIDSVKIENIFIEKGFKWGSSDEKTIILNNEDTFYKDNKPEYPFQIVISFKEKQNNCFIAIPFNRTVLMNNYIKDTISTVVYINDSLHNPIGEKILLLW